MSKDFEFSNLKLTSFERDKNGFLGRYKITDKEIEEYRTDQWKEGTNYSIYPFQTNEKQFCTFVLNQLILCAPQNIFSAITKFHYQSMYLPMALTENKLICLDNQIPELTYGFLKDATIDYSCIRKLLGQSVPFEPALVDKKTLFLSMLLTVKDVWYVANATGVKLSTDNMEVILIPIHYVSFDYEGKHFILFALGDSEMSSFYSNHPLPQDKVLMGERLLYRFPWLTNLILFAFILTLVISVCLICYKLWNLWSIFVLYKLVIFGIPIFIIYIIAFGGFIVLGRILNFIFLNGEKHIAKWLQRRAISHNFNIKRVELSNYFSGYSVRFPDVNDIDIDLSSFEEESIISNVTKK